MGAKKREKKLKVPSFAAAYALWASGEFLTLRDTERTGAMEQFTGENVNLALICALLLTTFLPMYYTEPSRLSIPEDGLSIDIDLGFFNTHITHLNKETLHDFFDICYVVAMGAMMMGTIICVFFVLAANEAGSDERVVILRDRLGWVSRFPYLYFSIGAYAWGISVYCHMFITAREPGAMCVKVFIISVMACGLVLLLIPRLCQSLYTGFVEEQDNPPVFIATKDIRERLGDYWKEVAASDKSEDFDLDGFLDFLHSEETKWGYRIPLLASVRTNATRLFYERLADQWGITYDQLIQLKMLENKH